ARRAGHRLLERRAECVDTGWREAAVLAGDGDLLGGGPQGLGGLQNEASGLLRPATRGGAADQAPALVQELSHGARNLLAGAQLEARGGQGADNGREAARGVVEAARRGAGVHRARVAVIAAARGPDHARRPVGQRGGRGGRRRGEARRGAGRRRGGGGGRCGGGAGHARRGGGRLGGGGRGRGGERGACCRRSFHRRRRGRRGGGRRAGRGAAGRARRAD